MGNQQSQTISARQNLNSPIVSHDQRLRRVPELLGQLVMESSGEDVTMDGKILDCHASQIIYRRRS